ncbi:Hpt domain-containing protein [Azospirillum rugosum]|uniref:HPt (Histidine-containing phosphotransfer) domain-containing protein n=1 Tax=Azospirillum rugosum TaxID=416170 RepID=A0ABS4SD69_9PROT|nr:Hpt domain-containing protein [Azospirillum rugosum]MBP2290511.1 HPt (histidine-containing phosphotransfer) domain-containing protein [Azospirillum rugosum]MDQ0525399.1 HPt (histidine-containing phosphotransfer) domain-containing protein [Azospirillum rugosum]
MPASPPPSPLDAPAASGPDPEVLDVEPMVRNFGTLGPTVTMLYDLFLKNERDLAERLRDRLEQDDLPGARLAAHAAAGAARTAGAHRLAGLFSAIEENLLSGDADRARLQARAIAPALDDVHSMIARI